MRSLTIDSNSNRYEIQKSLESFGWLSAVDINWTNQKHVELTEVGIFERLRRAITGNTEREKASQDALLKLAEINPAIGAALGTSIAKARTWSASELRTQLELPADRLKKDEAGARFQIPNSDALGLATIRPEESNADLVVRWKIIPKNGVDRRSESAEIKAEEKNAKDNRVIDYAVAEAPKDNELQASYASILKSATEDGYGHVALSPVPDKAPAGRYDGIHHTAFSDDSIAYLLDAIETMRSTNPSAPRVTITTDRIPGLADRIKDIQVRRKANSKTKPSAQEKVAAMPPALKALVPGLQNLPKVSATHSLGGVEKINGFENVRLFWGAPHGLAAETMILQFNSLEAASNELDKKGLPQLGRLCEMMFDPHRLLGKEVKEVTVASNKQWGLEALQMPPCELYTTRLFAMNLHQEAMITADKAEEFFLNHLKISEGRIVIDLPRNAEARNGLLKAIQKFKGSDDGKNAEIILATSDEAIYRSFSKESKSPSLTPATVKAKQQNENTKVSPKNSSKITSLGSAKAAPSTPGIYFFKDSALKLRADRIFVPQAMAPDGTPTVTGIDYEAVQNSEEIKQLYSDFLGKFSGSVVIDVEPMNASQASAVFEAVLDATKTNFSLAVSFAATSKADRQKLDNAASQVLRDRKEAEFDMDAPDPYELPLLGERWKNA